jgi:hypothetical protein
VGTFAGIMASVCVLIAMQIGWCLLMYRRKKNDEMWQVNPEELNFSYPVEVIGQGAFGVVLAAEYRGTRVAIKRVVPKHENNKSKRGSTKGGSVVSVNGRSARSAESNQPSNPDSGEITDPENGFDPLVASETNTKESTEDEDPLGGLAVGKKKTMLGRLLPSFFRDDQARSNLNLLGTASGSATTKSVFARVFPKCDETSRRQQEFLVEMRLLSKLRHPCKFHSFFV